MKNMNVTHSNFVTDEMDVNLNVFSPLVSNHVSGKLNGVHVVTTNNGSFGERGM